ncbi:BapA prefix-like domain-containing protein, partial [Halomonas sp. FME1]
MDNAFIAVTAKAGGDTVEIPSGSAVDLQVPSVVKVSVGPEDIASFDRSGMDLIITLKSGEQITIAGFFNVSEGERSELLLEDSDGVIWWGQYETPWSGFSFAEIQEASELSGGGIPPWALALGLIGLGGVAIAAADSSSDNDSDSNADTSAPGVPTVDNVTNTFDENGDPDGTTVSGMAEPGSTVEIRDADGNVVGTGEADENGNYEITTDEPLADGEEYD